MVRQPGRQWLAALLAIATVVGSGGTVWAYGSSGSPGGNGTYYPGREGFAGRFGSLPPPTSPSSSTSCGSPNGWQFSGACTGNGTGWWVDYHCGNYVTSRSQYAAQCVWSTPSSSPSGSSPTSTSSNSPAPVCGSPNGWRFSGCTGNGVGTWTDYSCGTAVTSHTGNAPSGQCVVACGSPNGWQFAGCTGNGVGTWNDYHCGTYVGSNTGNAPAGQCVSQPAACGSPNGWVFAGCTGAYTGTWKDYDCGAYVTQDTGNAPSGECVPGSAGSTASPASSGGGASSPAPSCAPSASTSCSAPVLTGCAGSCTTSGCTGTGTATGSESCTVSHSCPSYASSYSQSVTTGTSACQAQAEHQCAWAQPGYAQVEYCLTGPQGGLVNCSGWSTPYYDPYDCPIPTPVKY